MNIAGKSDAFSLGLIGVGIQTLNPILWAVNPIAAAVAVALGTGGLLFPRAKLHYEKWVWKNTEGILIESDPVPNESFMESGYRLGLTRDNAYPVHLCDDLAVRHTAIVGQSGVGKTTLAMYLLAQQIARNGGFLFIDAKIDLDTLNQLQHLAKLNGREDELYVLNVSDPLFSNTYSPLIHGDADEKSARVMNLQEENANADHYRQSAAHAFRVIFDALDRLNYTYTFADVTTLCQSSKALTELQRELSVEHPSSSELMAFTTFLEQYSNANQKTGEVTVNIELLKKNIGGMVSRMSQFAGGKFGEVFNSYNPEIDLFDIIMNNKMLYVMIPTMAKDIQALNLAKMILSDLRSVVAKIQGLPEYMRPNPNFIALCDEMGSYAIDSVRTLFEQGRSAHIQMMPAFQSFSQLNRVSPDFSDIIIQNTWNKVFFKFGSKDAPEDAATILGSCTEFIRSITASTSESTSAQSLRTSPAGSDSGGVGISTGWREQEAFIVKPDMLRGLGKGQSMVQIGADVFCIDTPMIGFPSKLPDFQVTKFRVKTPPNQRNYEMSKRYKEYSSMGGEKKNKSNNASQGEY